MAGIGTLNATGTWSFAATGSNLLSGPTGLGSVQAGPSIKKTISWGTTAADAAVGGADEAFAILSSISASSSVSIDFNAGITDIMGIASVALARLKCLAIQLLSAADDSVNGTAASYVTLDGTVSNGLTSQSGSGGLFSNVSKLDIPNGSVAVPFCLPSAAGVAVDSTHKVVKLTNADGALTAKTLSMGVGGTA